MPDSVLKQVTFVGRHSVRSPLPGEIEYAAPYITQPWPSWDVAHSQLSEHGRKVARNMGRWWKIHYGPQLAGSDRPKDWIYSRADCLQRDVDTGDEFFDGFLGKDHNDIEVESDPITTPDSYDPLFMPIHTGMVKVTGLRDAMLGRMGGNVDNAIRVHRPVARSHPAHLRHRDP
jgi:hypothetical protein